jgi:hypothetical protein
MYVKFLTVEVMVVGMLLCFPALAKKNSGLSSPSGSSHSVRGHVRQDGTYVQPHRATNQNQTQRDNWSSKPNVNPNTGKPGSKEPQY